MEHKHYLKGLNGLRFIAAAMVVVTHIELLKMYFDIPHVWHNPFIQSLGGLGVYFFFSLSGFLITYLLLIEKEKNGTIDIKSFYMRRILRIWPLYYLILVLGFFILPQVDFIRIPIIEPNLHDHFTSQLVSYLLIFPNIGYAMHGPVAHIGQMWSIGVEEQFYLLWPLIIYRIKNKYIKAFSYLIVGIVLIKVFYLLLMSTNYSFIKPLLAMSKFENMIVGGIAAYYAYYKPKRIQLVFHPIIQISSIALIPCIIYFTPELLQDGIHIVYAVLFCIIILNVSFNKNAIFIPENNLLTKLGDISYGIYMYHMMIIPIVLVFLKEFINRKNPIVFNILSYLIIFGLTIVVSQFSYIFFEKKFLKLKRKYSRT